MICYACRAGHKGKPEACYDCDCQHKGELIMPPKFSEPVHWFCKTCALTVAQITDGCDCILGEEGERVPVFEHELEGGE